MNDNLSKLLQIEHNCKSCESHEELEYIIVNETRELIEYDQAILYSPIINGTPKAIAISDIPIIDQTSIYVQYINKVAKAISKNNYNEITTINFDSHAEQNQNDQIEDFPSKLLWIPLKASKNSIDIEFYLLLLKNENWKEEELEMMEHLSVSFSYFLYAMRKCNISRFKFSKKYFFGFLILFSSLFFIPIQMSVLAPFEVQPKDPYIVTPAINGTIDKVLVKPNQQVKKGSLVVKIKDIDYKSKVDIAQKKLDITKAQLYTLTQVSFYDKAKNSEKNRLENEIKLKQAELEFAISEYKKTKIYAKLDGIVIVNNPQELQGQPITIGEKILSIANSNNIEIKIMLPVTDAIYLEGNNNVKLFFDNTFLDTWDGKISQISYKPTLTPEGILSYQIIANFDNINQNGTIPKIGLRGTAKIYAQQTTLFYYLFRKPVTYLRQLLAW